MCFCKMCQILAGLTCKFVVRTFCMGKLTIQFSTTPMIFVLLENFEVGVGRDVGVAHAN